VDRESFEPLSLLRSRQVWPLARLDHAMRLLTTPTLAHHNIAAVAYAAGFGDLSYFNRTFRRRYAFRHPM
jgi:AraC-like DNA-binding protein